MFGEKEGRGLYEKVLDVAEVVFPANVTNVEAVILAAPLHVNCILLAA